MEGRRKSFHFFFAVVDDVLLSLSDWTATPFVTSYFFLSFFLFLISAFVSTGKNHLKMPLYIMQVIKEIVS